MRPYDIYFGRVTWGGCPDERPWLIVADYDDGFFGCFPISGNCYSGSCFPIDAAHPDFPRTGLTKSCFVHDSWIIRVDGSCLVRRKGELQNQLLRDFLAFSGLS